MFRSNRSSDPSEIAITISVKTFAKVIAMVVGTIVLLLAVKRASHALLLIFFAFFLALALNAPVNWVSQRLPGKRRGSRALATSLSFLLVVVLLGAFLGSLVPPLARQTQSLVSAAPHLVQDFGSQDSQAGRIIRRYHLQNQVTSVSNQLSARLKHAGGSAFSTVQRVGGSVFALVTILVLTFMMLVEGPAWVLFLRDFIPDRRHLLADRLAQDMYGVIKGFVNGQVTLAALAALLISPALFILHVSYPVALIVIIFICGLIPMVGHTIGAIIVTFVALFHSASAAFIILAYYILYQQIENYTIQPRIQANSTNMSPLLVFVAVVIGVSFGGLFGALVAIPFAGCVRIVVLECLRNQKTIDGPYIREAIKDATIDTK